MPETSYLDSDVWTIELGLATGPVSGGGRSYWRIVEIPASYDTTEEWTASFWSIFRPNLEEPRFRQLVEDPGIWIRLKLAYREGEKWEAVEEVIRRRLPQPPIAGYEWAGDNGGVRFAPRQREDGRWVETVTFRLWNPKVGYMPASE